MLAQWESNGTHPFHCGLAYAGHLFLTVVLQKGMAAFVCVGIVKCLTKGDLFKYRCNFWFKKKDKTMKL